MNKSTFKPESALLDPTPVSNDYGNKSVKATALYLRPGNEIVVIAATSARPSLPSPKGVHCGMHLRCVRCICEPPFQAIGSEAMQQLWGERIGVTLSRQNVCICMRPQEDRVIQVRSSRVYASLAKLDHQFPLR